MHVVILGAGIMGLASAWRLARAGHQVTVLERRECGGGATRASLGALWPPSPLADGPLQRLHRQSLALMAAFVAEVSADAGTAAGPAMLPFRRGGRIEFILDAEDVPRARQEAALGHPIAMPPGGPESVGLELIGPDEALRLEPLINPGGLHALHCRFTAQVEVFALVDALVAACRQRGVVFCEHTAADRLEIAEGRWAVHGGGRSFTGDRLLVTAGAWTAQLDPLLQRFAPTRPAKGQALALATARPLIRHIVKRGTTYLVPWDDRILVGSTTEPEAGFDESVGAAALETLRQNALSILPALREASVVRTWAGLRPDAPKHRPIMGPVPGVPGVVVCSGHYKTGIGMSALVSRLMCDLLTTGITPPEFADFLPRDRALRK